MSKRIAFLLLTSLCLAQTLAQTQAQTQAMLHQYCAVCHNPTLKSGGISLAELDLSDIAGNSGTLEKLLRKVHSGEMPPPSMPRPDASTARAFTQWLQAELDRAAFHRIDGRHAVLPDWRIEVRQTDNRPRDFPLQ